MRALHVLANRAGVIVCLGVVLVLVTACRSAVTPAPAPTPTATPAAKVTFSGSYSQTIQPIFTQNCVTCHGPQKAENGLRLDSCQAALKGTQYGPVIVPGEPAQSTLVSVIKGTASPTIRMPHNGVALSNQQIQDIVLWIQAGASCS